MLLKEIDVDREEFFPPRSFTRRKRKILSNTSTEIRYRWIPRYRSRRKEEGGDTYKDTMEQEGRMSEEEENAVGEAFRISR